MLPIVQTIQNRSDDHRLKFRQSFLESDEPIDDRRHDFQARYLLGEIIALQIFISEKLYNFFDLREMLPICIFGDDGFDIFAGDFAFLLVSGYGEFYLSLRFLVILGGN